MVKNFNKRLNELRCEKHLSIKGLADNLDISYKTAISYIKGKTKPRGTTLFKIAVLFNVSSDFLVGLTKERQIKKYD